MDPGRDDTYTDNDLPFRHVPIDMYTDNGLPFGYRFHPTALEVLQYYLVPKLKGEALPSEYVKDLDVYKYDPHQFPLNESKFEREEEGHFFVPVTSELLPENDNFTRPTPNGCWKVVKHNVAVYGPDGSTAIGYKNKLEFYNGRDKTNWKMVEYRTSFRVNDHKETCMVCRLKFKVKPEEIYQVQVEAESNLESTSDGVTGSNVQ